MEEEEDFLIEIDCVADSSGEVKNIHDGSSDLFETSEESPPSNIIQFKEKHGHREKPKYLKFVAESKLNFDPVEIEYISNLPFFKHTVGWSKVGLVYCLRVVATVKKALKRDGCQISRNYLTKEVTGSNKMSDEILNVLTSGKVLYTDNCHCENESRVFFIHNDYKRIITDLKARKLLQHYARMSAPIAPREIVYNVVSTFTPNEIEFIRHLKYEGKLVGDKQKTIDRLTHAITFFEVNEGMRMTTTEVNKAFGNSDRTRQAILKTLDPILFFDKTTKTYTICDWKDQVRGKELETALFFLEMEIPLHNKTL